MIFCMTRAAPALEIACDSREQKLHGLNRLLKDRTLEAKYDAKLEFPGGRGVQNKKPFVGGGGVWMFSGTAQCSGLMVKAYFFTMFLLMIFSRMSVSLHISCLSGLKIHLKYSTAVTPQQKGQFLDHRYKGLWSIPRFGCIDFTLFCNNYYYYSKSLELEILELTRTRVRQISQSVQKHLHKFNYSL